MLKNKNISLSVFRKQKTETIHPGGNRNKTEIENKVIKTNKVMKTKNNVQKTVVRSLAVVVSFVLISFTVTAQDFWKAVLANSSFNEIALAMAETSKKPTAPAPVTENNSAGYIYENEYDGKLALEYWMTDNNYFEATSITKVEKESTLQVEDWMFDESLFSGAQEADAELKVEDWMINDKVWVN